ncbi:MAG: 50S ribosomal protein L10 [Candidatus Omnitrophica bacterium]|nr:50S ribosomal protein L10 [Candidatus Omnitrophota bacterium]MCM8802685.1 50S ribosomal protein L10 [Candidatus Omnitrophota bacterium]
MKKWTKRRKEEVVQNLTNEFKNSKINILGTFSNLKVSEMQKIRESVKELGGNVMVLKNNLANIIFKNLSKDEVCKFISGPTFIVWSSKENEIDIIKSVLNFQKDTGKIEIRGGLLNGEIIEKSKIDEIGKLPGKKELQSMIISLVKMPTFRVVNALKNPITRVINVLNQIKTKKET